jgi:hypothetical protein
MPKVYAIPYMVYFEAFDDATAAKLGKLFGNRMTRSIRELGDGWIPDHTSVVVPSGEPTLAPPEDHAAALSYTPPKECWEDLSQQCINAIAGA